MYGEIQWDNFMGEETWSWHLYNANHVELASSRVYKTKQGCIRAFKRLFHDTPLVEIQ